MFWSAGSYCPTNTEEVPCGSGHYCRMGSTAETRCHSLTSCNSNTTRQNITQYGLMLIPMNPFAKHVCKDPQGYVPTNFATTTKKLKSLGDNNHLMAQALKSSSKLSCTVIAENLPDDHSHQNIEKIFSVIGSIKTIRICQPQKPSSSRSSKGDSVVSHKLHALVEYENPETAERAAKKLNDEKNGRKGMRVRVLLKRTVNVHPKSVLKNTKSGFDGYLDDDDDDGLLHLLHKDASRLNVSEVPEVGSYVVLKSVGDLNEIVAAGIVTKTKNVHVNGMELEHDFCEIIIQFQVKKDAKTIFHSW